MNTPGIRMYIEDPKVVIRRQIKRSLILIMAALILAAILIFLSVISIKKEAEAVSAKQNLIFTNVQNSTTNTSFDKNWQSISPYQAKIKDALPSSTDLLAYQGALELAAIASGVEISVSFSSSQKALTGVDHKVDIKGKMANFIQFIGKIENLPYYVQINNFNLNSSEGLDQDSQGTLNLKVYTK